MTITIDAVGPTPPYQKWDLPPTLLLTSGGHHWRPVQTCPIEDLPPPLPVVVATETCTVGKQAVCILLECCLVVVVLTIA